VCTEGPGAAPWLCATLHVPQTHERPRHRLAAFSSNTSAHFSQTPLSLRALLLALAQLPAPLSVSSDGGVVGAGVGRPRLLMGPEPGARSAWPAVLVHARQVKVCRAAAPAPTAAKGKRAASHQEADDGSGKAVFCGRQSHKVWGRRRRCTRDCFSPAAARAARALPCLVRCRLVVGRSVPAFQRSYATSCFRQMPFPAQLLCRSDTLKLALVFQALFHLVQHQRAPAALGCGDKSSFVQEASTRLDPLNLPQSWGV
jgi:hypothetical protein